MARMFHSFMCEKNYEKSLCGMCAFQLDIYKIVYRVIEIAEECSVNRSLLTFPQAPGGPHAVVATRVQNLQEMLQVCRLVMVCR